MVDKKRLFNTIKRLIALDSQNPPGNEEKVADFVNTYFKKLGLKTETLHFKKKRDNVLAVLKGGAGRNSLLLTPHLDTVPAGKNWRSDPFTVKVAGDRLYGLGATDCKGNLASCMEAVNSIVEDGIRLDYDLIIAATADEEAGSSLGLIPLLERGLIKPTAALVLDADDFEIVVTQKGLLHLKVCIRGRKAHGAYPWLGVNAIDIAAKVILDLKKHLHCRLKNKYLRNPTVNIGTINGGDKVNVVSDWCEFSLDYRFLPGMSEKEFLAALRKSLNKYTKNFKIEIQSLQAPYNIDPAHHLVRGLAGAIKEAGVKPRITGSEGATVITFFQSKGIPAVATGFGREGCAHIADEYAHLSSLYNGALVLESFLRKYEFDSANKEKIWKC
ncbi:MAG: M20 family metallopeptidase [Candidatus Omnitrophica bacterium]|nr:M20 family metallopeptidase [Candidatus Omnitrophota bacterium]MDD5500889.1 M20 family metallopeptidase [Candidatus Omnitrophota bacterium]